MFAAAISSVASCLTPVRASDQPLPRSCPSPKRTGLERLPASGVVVVGATVVVVGATVVVGAAEVVVGATVVVGAAEVVGATVVVETAAVVVATEVVTTGAVVSTLPLHAEATSSKATITAYFLMV